MKGKILIGAVSEHFGVSKQTLIHYDRIGLLKPSSSEINNYRYYSYEDLDKLDLILSLKDSGLSLNEIKEYISNPSLDESITLLKSQSEGLDNLIIKLQKTKLKIDYKVKELEYIQTLNFNEEITLSDYEDRYILKEDLNRDSEDIYEIAYAIKRLNYLVSHVEDYAVYSHLVEGVIIDHSSFEKNVFDDIISTFVFIDEYNNRENESIIPAGKYLSTQHHGLYSETQKSYKRLFDYMKSNNLEIAGNSIEIPLITAWGAKMEADYITEIQIPVKIISQS